MTFSLKVRTAGHTQSVASESDFHVDTTSTSVGNFTTKFAELEQTSPAAPIFAFFWEGGEMDRFLVCLGPWQVLGPCCSGQY